MFSYSGLTLMAQKVYLKEYHLAAEIILRLFTVTAMASNQKVQNALLQQTFSIVMKVF